MKMLHVTIQTDKFEEEIRFYEEQAGLRIQEDLRPMGRPIVFLAEESEGVKVEIIQNPEAKDAGNQNLSRGFGAEDLDRKYGQLKEAGYAVSPMQSPGPAVRFFFVKDPAGVTVQFM